MFVRRDCGGTVALVVKVSFSGASVTRPQPHRFFLETLESRTRLLFLRGDMVDQREAIGVSVSYHRGVKDDGVGLSS